MKGFFSGCGGFLGGGGGWRRDGDWAWGDPSNTFFTTLNQFSKLSPYLVDWGYSIEVTQVPANTRELFRHSPEHSAPGK